MTQRGNRRADLFETDEDRRAYLRDLKHYADRHGLAVWAYCLMSHHIHLVVVPEREASLAKALRDVHTVHATRFNARTGLSGHVWQGRFYSCPLDESHRWAAVRYVERNPVRAGIVSRAQDNPWSSAGAHCGMGENGVHLFPSGGPPLLGHQPIAECDIFDESEHVTLSKGFDGLLAGESWAEASLPGSTLLGPQLDYVV